MTILESELFCYVSMALYLCSLPSTLALSLGALYIVMWIDYIQRLFRGVNDILKQQKIPLDIVTLQRCKVQYTVLCGLIENVNKHYGILIVYYLFSMTFMLFIYGFSIIKRVSSGMPFDVENFLMVFLLVIATFLLFGFSCGLKSEVRLKYA